METESEPVSEETEKPDTPPLPKKNGLVKKLSMSVISKESLLLVPEGGETVLQNGHSHEKSTDQNEQAELGVNNNNEKNTNQVIILSCQ